MEKAKTVKLGRLYGQTVEKAPEKYEGAAWHSRPAPSGPAYAENQPKGKW